MDKPLSRNKKKIKNKVIIIKIILIIINEVILNDPDSVTGKC